jgi:hypothetical protein
MRGVWGLVLLLLAAPAFAQAPVQSVPSELRASQVCADSRSAAAAGGSVSLTPPSGNFLYINSIEINAAASTAAAATLGTPASATTTNIPGTPTMGAFPIQTQAAGVKIGDFFYALSGNGLKSSAPGTAVTITTPAVTGVAWHISMCGYYAP